LSNRNTIIMARTRSSNGDRGGPLYFIEEAQSPKQTTQQTPQRAEPRKIKKEAMTPTNEKRENQELKSHLTMARELIDRLHAEVESGKTRLKTANQERDKAQAIIAQQDKALTMVRAELHQCTNQRSKEKEEAQNLVDTVKRLQSICEQQRKNIHDKDACVLRKMTKIDEQQRENEKLVTEISNLKVKLESDSECARERHSKESKILTDRLDFAANQADWYRQNSHHALRKLSSFHEQFLRECRDTFHFDPKFEFDFDLASPRTPQPLVQQLPPESPTESTKEISSDDIETEPELCFEERVNACPSCQKQMTPGPKGDVFLVKLPCGHCMCHLCYARVKFHARCATCSKNFKKFDVTFEFR